MMEARSRFHHVGLAVADLETARVHLAGLFGYRLVSGPFDDPIQKVSLSFLQSPNPGEPLLELVAPGAGPDSPVNRYLKRGIGAYHMCHEVNDLDAWLADAHATGCILIGAPVPAVAFEGRRIAWLYTPSKLLIEALSHE